MAWALGQPEQGRDAAEGEAGGHQQRGIGRFRARIPEQPRDRPQSQRLRHEFRQEQPGHRNRGRRKSGNRHERAGADEIERSEKPEGERSKSSEQRMVLAHCAGQDHADEIRGEDRFAVCPRREAAERKKHEKQAQQ